MKQNNFVGFSKTGSPITVPKLSDEEHLSSRIKEMKGIASTLTEAEKQKRPLAELLNGNFCVGEAHADISPKRFLIENMSTFKERGFSVLFMEHLAADRDLGERLGSLDFQYMDNKSEYNFTNVVKAAQDNGIEIVNLEESNEIYKRYRNNSERMVSLNYNAREVIEKKEREFLDDTGNALKWFAFVGFTHLNSYYGVPGICEIIPNVQDVLITDSGKLPDELRVSMIIGGDPGQDMKIASILDRQRGEEKAPEKRDRSSSDEVLPEVGLPEVGLPYRPENEKERNIQMSPLKVIKVRDSSTAPLSPNPSKNNITKL